ncbi:MAG: immunoglobulin-like domain-containing protein, partial [Sarcina sp.]
QRIVTEKITNEYFSNYIGYNEFLNIKILDKLSKEKLNLSLTGWDYFSSGKVEKLNNFKYEYGDIIKISGKILERQSIGGRVIGATRDYSKGLNNIDDMDNLGFEITPNGLKEIRNKAPIIKNIDSIKLIKNNNFNALRNVVAIDDLDGDITDKVIVEGFIDTTRVGEYTLKYNVKDSWNKVTENIRKITVIENPKLNENIIKVNGDFSSFGEERFNIEFDDLNKKLKIRTDLIQIKGSNSEKLIFNPKLSTKDKDKKYFYIEIFDKTRKSKVLVELKGDDDATSYKLNPLKGFKYEYGDIIKFWHRHADILEICGDVIDRKESYLDGIQNNIEEVQFEITKNGLK